MGFCKADIRYASGIKSIRFSYYKLKKENKGMKKTLFLVALVMALGFSMTAYAKEFDPAFYGSSYQDVASVYGTDGAALFKHYTEHGKAEGRIPYNGAAAGEEVTFSGNASAAQVTQPAKSASKLVTWMKKYTSKQDPESFWTDEHCEKYGPIIEADLMKCPVYANAEIVSGEKWAAWKKGVKDQELGTISDDSYFGIRLKLSNGWILSIDDFGDADDLDNFFEAEIYRQGNAFENAYEGQYRYSGEWEKNYDSFLAEHKLAPGGTYIYKY